MKKLKLFNKCVFILLALIVGSVFQLPAQTNSWVQLESMNTARAGAKSVLFDSMIYIFGGLNNTPASLNSAEAYNIKSNEWHAIKDSPGDLYLSSAGIINDTIYLSGGWIGSGDSWSPTNPTFSYDPKDDDWQIKKEFPKNVAGSASCVFNDKLYVFGGLKNFAWIDSSGQNETFVYNPSLDTWDQLCNMKYRRGNGSSACVYNNMIYVIGGSYDHIDQICYPREIPERYDPLLDVWNEIPEMPVPVLYHGSIVYNDKIYVFGGEKSIHTTPTKYIQEYDPSLKRWHIMENMPIYRSYIATQRYENHCYLFGGYSSGQEISAEVWMYNLDSLKEGCEEISIKEFELPSVGDSVKLSVDVLPYDFGNKTVEWYLDNQSIASVSKEGYLKIYSPGTATITAKLRYGSCSDSLVDIDLGITDIKMTTMSIYPNPTKDLFTLYLKSSTHGELVIHNLKGQLFHRRPITSNSEKINISNYPKGIYFVTVLSDSWVRTEKVVRY